MHHTNENQVKQDTIWWNAHAWADHDCNAITDKNLNAIATKIFKNIR